MWHNVCPSAEINNKALSSCAKWSLKSCELATGKTGQHEASNKENY
jgi:hypothetical protein